MGRQTSSQAISDTILVTIPIGVTADLGIAMRRCRDKRLRKMKDLYPYLFENGSQGSSADEDKSPKKKQKRKYGSELVPQREEYGHMLDYLEAKYVQGVMVPEVDAKKVDDPKSVSDSSSGGAGSCYSDASGFVDDSLLRNEVAEQVLASSSYGATKIEEETKKEKGKEDSFFVNVGDLEMAEGYDEKDVDIDFNEVQRSKKKLKMRNKKKLIKTEGQVAKKKIKVATTTEAPSVSSMSSTNIKPSKTKNIGEKIQFHVNKKVQILNQRSGELKQIQLKMYKIVKKKIHQMPADYLPRKQEKNEMIKVSITIPQNKSAGDDITFSNPRVPGQKLRVKVPESGIPGGKFVVSLPAPESRQPTLSANNFTKEAKEALDDYSRAYDEWIEAKARWREYQPKLGPYKPNNERLKKFDHLIQELPSDLATPIDAAFLRKVVRRARQNSSKRRKMLEIQSMERKKDIDGPSETLELRLPHMGMRFETVIFNKNHFAR